MNTLEIEKHLSNDVVCRRIFKGIYSRDNLPVVDVDSALIICNTDYRRGPGEHWVVFYFNDNRGEYFDSFGRYPEEHFVKYLNANCSSWTFNKTQIQSIISQFCGHYCILYAMFRARGLVLSRIVKLFTKDTGFNDSIVHNFVCNKT